MIKLLLILGSYQSIIITLFLILQKGPEEKAKRLLGVFFLFLCMFYTTRLTLEVNYQFYKYAEFITFPITLMLFPLFYFYIRLIVGQTIHWRSLLTHLFPVLSFGLLYAILYGLMPEPQKVDYFRMSYLDILTRGAHEYPAAILSSIALFIMIPVQAFSYSIYIIHLLLTHRKHLKDHFSSTQHRTLTWALVLAGLFGTDAIAAIIMVLSGSAVAEKLFFIVSLPIFAAMGLFGIAQPQIYGSATKPDQKLPDSCIKVVLQENEETSIVTPAESSLQEKISTYFLNHRPYLDADLSIEQIARVLLTNKTYVSRTLNTGFGMNFYAFVNKYRIEEAKRRLQDPANQNYSIEGIALESGFRSLSAFYVAFKSVEKITPAAFRRIK